MKRLLIIVLPILIFCGCKTEEAYPSRIFSGGYSFSFKYGELCGVLTKPVGESFEITFCEPSTLKNLKMTYRAGEISVANGSSFLFSAGTSMGDISPIVVIPSVVEESIRRNSLKGETKEGKFEIQIKDSVPVKIDIPGENDIIITDFKKGH